MKKNLGLLILFLCFWSSDIKAAQRNDIIRTVLDRVVMIIAMDEYSQPLGMGSGFVIGTNGEIATNYHVVEGASSALIKFVNKENKYQAVSIVQKNVKYDLAIINTDTDLKLAPLPLGDDEMASIGNRILAIGNPEGLEGTVSEGIISGFRKIDENFRLMQITAPISPGSSGGPIVNQEGQVIGIASASIIVGQNLNFAVPVKILKELYSQPRLNLPFQKKNLPVENDFTMTGKTKDTDLVKALNVRIGQRYMGDSADLTFSIRNGSRRDIKNIKVLILWKDPATGEAVHFTPVLVKDTIPSLQTKLIQVRYVEVIGVLNYDIKTDTRIIDYEILSSSGLIEFK